ncbi:hypothetical protein BSL78_24297 [Apostichopus japonicus]|uniref:Uncharacterized protein n=1 Tax=Stichopus japonicus TaxID=307972 RepID=A0A2G8JT23_STIJA|nr:hypothetical protein BSL78_24297 [Apostichopus japonicus]
MKNDGTDMYEDDTMNQRVIGVRRRRRVKRVLLAVFIVVAVTSFWQLSRRDSELTRIDGIQVSGQQRLQVGVPTGDADVEASDDITREHTNNSSRNVSHNLSGADDRNPMTSESLTNQVITTATSNKTITQFSGHLNVSSKIDVNDTISANADVANADKDDDNKEMAPNTNSSGNHEDLKQADDQAKAKMMDDVREKSQSTVNKTSTINTHEEEEDNPLNGDEVEGDKQTSEEKIVKNKPINKLNNESSKEENDIKMEGDTLTAKAKNIETVSKPAELLQYNYSEPRYSVSEDGQFKLIKFVDEKVNISFSQSLKYSPFSQVDKVYLTLLAQGEIREIYSIQHHEHLRLVAFDAPTLFHNVIPIESCPLCGAIKRPKDLNEVLAFHVDRTLGIERALPATGRKFMQIELDNLKFEGDNPDVVFPVMWFARDLMHRGKFQKDQNSMQLSWRQYQEILSKCHDPSNLTEGFNCTDVNYSDWSRMAVLDFIMQILLWIRHRRGEGCFRNEILKELDSCDDVDKRFLVHILTSKSNPSELVLLDNAGNIGRKADHLNYELLTGIRMIPKSIMKNIFAEDLKSRLLRSLEWDTVYWKTIENDGVNEMVDTIIERVEKLKLYINEHNIMAS